MRTDSASVIVLDDHPLVGRGVAQYLQSVEPALEVLVATGWNEVEQIAAVRGRPRLLVADIWLADGSSIDALSRSRADCPAWVWMAVSGDDDPALARRARDAGARGFVHKAAPPERFGQAFRTVLGGGEWFDETPGPGTAGATGPREWPVSARELGLTPRQGEILMLVLRGLPNKRIALHLGITESTVKEHVTGILERLGVRSRVEAITRLRGRQLDIRA
jgi:DNA-binding NarL/FixJ family response regulator